MRQALCLIGCFFVVAPLWGQSTISARPLELTVSNGLWGALLPAYELGVNDNGAPAFRDNLDDVGYMGDLKLVRRFLGTRTSFETRGFFATAESVSKTGVIGIDVPSPIDGASNPLVGSRTQLKSNVNHYGFDIALRDTWRTRFGGLSGGAAFSYLKFDQKFDANYGAADLLREKLDTKFRGGKAIFGWDGCICERPSNIDLVIGVYDMDVDYRFRGQSITGRLHDKLSKTTTTIETNFTTYQDIRRYRFGFTFGVTWFNDLPVIQHNIGTPVTLATDDAVTLTGKLQVLL